MVKIDWTYFDELVDEALLVINEDFREAMSDCCDIEDVRSAIRSEIRKKKVDFIKIIALALAGEGLRADE